MSTCKKPLKRSILLAILTFLTLLGILLGFTQYLLLRGMLYDRYEFYIENLLNYTASLIDKDDLAQCVRTGKESEKFRQLQTALDNIRENSDFHFLYVIVPLNDNETDNIMNVIAAVTQEEYREIPDLLVHLGQLTGTSYSPETARKYLTAYESGQLSFFEEVSEWGDDYTGLLPLYDSAGNRFAALCLDVDILSIHAQLFRSTALTVGLIALLGAAAALLFLRWTNRTVTQPLEQLEQSAARFASNCLKQDDPEALQLDLPAIRTGNEVESLAQAILKMCQAMQSYLLDCVNATSELAKMTDLANKDSLTSAYNKTAYDSYLKDLQEQLDQEPFPFAVLMADLNRLKWVNDQFGHDKGDKYIKKGCALLTQNFSNSPVFRVGGDEFTVVLIGEDYDDRHLLLKKAREDFAHASSDQSAKPWARASISIGMADYRQGRDKTIREVMMRADNEMYKEKRRRKLGRE